MAVGRNMVCGSVGIELLRYGLGWWLSVLMGD